jgi:hypothetical protein
MSFEEVKREILVFYGTSFIMFLIYYVFNYLEILDFWFGVIYGIVLITMYKLVKEKYDSNKKQS